MSGKRSTHTFSYHIFCFTFISFDTSWSHMNSKIIMDCETCTHPTNGNMNHRNCGTNSKLIAIRIELPFAYAVVCIAKAFLSLLMIISRYASLYRSSVTFDDIIFLLTRFLTISAVDPTALQSFAVRSFRGYHSN